MFSYSVIGWCNLFVYFVSHVCIISSINKITKLHVRQRKMCLASVQSLSYLCISSSFSNKYRYCALCNNCKLAIPYEFTCDDRESEAPLTSVFTSLQASEMFDIFFRVFSYYKYMATMAFPVVEFSREGYKIRKVFG